MKFYTYTYMLMFVVTGSCVLAQDSSNDNNQGDVIYRSLKTAQKVSKIMINGIERQVYELKTQTPKIMKNIQHSSQELINHVVQGLPAAPEVITESFALSAQAEEIQAKIRAQQKVELVGEIKKIKEKFTSSISEFLPLEHDENSSNCLDVASNISSKDSSVEENNQVSHNFQSEIENSIVDQKSQFIKNPSMTAMSIFIENNPCLVGGILFTTVTAMALYLYMQQDHHENQDAQFEYNDN